MLCFVDEVFETNTVPFGHREREIYSETFGTSCAGTSWHHGTSEKTAKEARKPGERRKNESHISFLSFPGVLETTKKSISAVSAIWFFRKVFHVCEGGPLRRFMYLATHAGRITTTNASTNRISRLHSTGKRPFYRGWPAVESCRKSLWRRKDEAFSRDSEMQVVST